MSAATQLVQVEHRDGDCFVTLHGEIDVASTDCLRGVAAAVIATSEAREIIIDLSDVTFIDSSGLGALVAIRNAGSARGMSTRAIGLQPHPRSIFAMTALDQAFRVEDDVPSC